MKLYKKIIGVVFIITLLFNIYQIFIGVSLISQPDVAYKVGGILGFLLSATYSYWLIGSAFHEAKYKGPGYWVIKSIAIFCMAFLLVILFYSFYLNRGQVELIYDLFAVTIMLAFYLPIVIYDLKLISKSRSLN
ncbi:hypothetical protein [Dyadobacter sp. 32]|uniref:hypothetical protein n=1 Tax=Dyadobacter sp. 32 TaxID=538966 RepID=UPI0011ED67FB